MIRYGLILPKNAKVAMCSYSICKIVNPSRNPNWASRHLGTQSSLITPKWLLMAWHQLSVYWYLELNWFKHHIYNPWENADPGMQTTYYQSQFEQTMLFKIISSNSAKIFFLVKWHFFYCWRNLLCLYTQCVLRCWLLEPIFPWITRSSHFQQRLQ